MADPKMPEKLGRYEVVRELGKGAMGVVYEGKDPNIGRRVAIKTARREVVEASGMADEMMERFLREAQAAGALNHPNIITIYDAAEEEGIAYIAMEYLEGGDLGDVIESKKKLSMEEIVEIGANICEALDVAHSHGVIHRDIKPANILMPKGKPLKVADFGIAHVSDSNLTQDGALIGTPHYMSPEQFMGQKLDGRSDLFSVGNILYELTTGEKPFSGEALSTVMHKVIKTDPVNPVELNFAMPDALGQVIMKALSKRPAHRYKTGREMAAALMESIKESPNPAILDPSTATAMGATVTGGTPAAGGATVIGDAPSQQMAATLPGTQPGSQETTIASSGPGATVAGSAPGLAATAPGGAPPSATAPGAPPSPATAGDELAATVPGAMPADETAGGTMTSPAGPNKGLLIGGGVAAALILVVGGILLTGGGEPDAPAAGNNGATSPPATSTTPPAATASKNYYTGALFEIYRTQNLEDYKGYDRGTMTLDDLNGKLDEVKGVVRIELLDANGQVIVDNPDWNVGDWIDIDPALKASTLSYRAHIPTPTPDNPTETSLWKGEVPPADGPDATANVVIMLAPAQS